MIVRGFRLGLAVGGLVLLVLVGAAAPATAARTAAAAGAPGTATTRHAAGVIVVGVAGLRWDDIGPSTPALLRLARSGAVGVLSVKARPAVSCPADGWLTLGAGARAEAFTTARAPCGASLALDTGDAPRNDDTADGARVGALTDALDGGVVTSGAGAELALGTPAAAPLGARVTVVDAGVLDEDDRDTGLRAADRAVAEALHRRPPDADLLVVGVSEGAGGDTAHLHVAMATGPSFPRGALRSASTRRAPYVQLVDVAPTVLDRLGLPVPDVMDGQPWQVVGTAPPVSALADLDDRATTAKRVTVPFYVVLVAVLLALPAALRARPSAARAVALAGTAAPAASYLAQLVPWWRSPLPLLALLSVVAVLAASAALVLRRVGAVCAFTVVVLVTDLLAGAPLQMDSVAGYSPLVAGRFAGLGNVAFGVYGTAWLLLAASLAQGRTRRGAGLRVAAAGCVAVVVAGAPPWGSDVGGVLALLPSFVVLGLLVTGRRVSVPRLLVAGLAAGLVVGVFALLDLARPAQDRTHLGRFAADVRDGAAGELLERKASAVFALLFSSPVTAALPLVVAAAVWLVLRPPAPLRRAFADAPALRPGLTAVGVLSLLGFALNDSGAAVPALALLVAVPATLAVVFGSAAARVPQLEPTVAPVD